MINPFRASLRIYAGLFTVTLATLMFEILLTRIFSVTMWYHYAFMAISLAMLGMAAGAVAVYLHPDQYLDASRLSRQIGLSSLLFGWAALMGFLVHRAMAIAYQATWEGLAILVTTYLVMAGPFFFSGICVSVALTKFPDEINKLYAADLAGAAAGCLLLIWTLKHTDGPSAVLIVTALASVGSALFLERAGTKGLLGAAVISAFLFATLAAVSTALARKQSSPLRLKWTKSGVESQLLYEKWNPFSRIAVANDRGAQSISNPEGISRTCQVDRAPYELSLTIDAAAETTLTEIHGDLGPVGYLKYDVKNLVHYLRPGADVMIVGAGAGRDVLSALAFGQHSVRALEFNEDVLKTVNGRFGDFTGHLDHDPRVVFVNDEARSYIARSRQHVDPAVLRFNLKASLFILQQ